MKETAVEQLFRRLWEEPKDKLTWYAILKEAKEMEKQMIIDAYIDGEFTEGYGDDAEQYYNETFKK